MPRIEFIAGLGDWASLQRWWKPTRLLTSCTCTNGLILGEIGFFPCSWKLLMLKPANLWVIVGMRQNAMSEMNSKGREIKWRMLPLYPYVYALSGGRSAHIMAKRENVSTPHPNVKWNASDTRPAFHFPQQHQQQNTHHHGRNLFQFTRYYRTRKSSQSQKDTLITINQPPPIAIKNTQTRDFPPFLARALLKHSMPNHWEIICTGKFSHTYPASKETDEELDGGVCNIEDNEDEKLLAGPRPWSHDARK